MVLIDLTEYKKPQSLKEKELLIAKWQLELILQAIGEDNHKQINPVR